MERINNPIFRILMALMVIGSLSWLFITYNNVRDLEVQVQNYVSENSALKELLEQIKRIDDRISILDNTVHNVSTQISDQKTLLINPPKPPLVVASPTVAPTFNCKGRGTNIKCTKDCEKDPRKWSESGPDLCEYLNLRNYEFFSIRFGIHAQRHMDDAEGGMFAFSYADFMVFDHLFDTYRKLGNITEVGTAAGVTSAYLGLAALPRNGIVHTFDYKDIRDKRALKLWPENVLYFQEDVLSTVNQKVVESVSRGPMFVFFDNGNKAHEINTYAKFIVKDSVMLTHDWDDEIRIGDIQHTLDQLHFVPVLHNVAEILGSHVRAWYKEE